MKTESASRSNYALKEESVLCMVEQQKLQLEAGEQENYFAEFPALQQMQEASQ